MSQRLFETRYDRDWQTLEAILDKKFDSADSENASLPVLYRRACHQLAIAKHRRYSSQLISRLNQLVLRGHHRLYQYSPRFQTRWLRFFAYDFPRSIRRNANYVWAATALFYLPLIVLGIACYVNGDLIYSLVAPEFVAQFEQMYSDDAEKFGRERAS
ncbi:MAG: stage II sporulation protein M, partial [Pseudomonadota bacterium]